MLLDIGYYTSHPKKTKAITYINLYRLKDVMPCLLLITCQIKFLHILDAIFILNAGLLSALYQNGNSHHQRDQRYLSKLKESKVKKGKLQYKTKTIPNGFGVHCSIQLVIKTTQIIYIYDVML